MYLALQYRALLPQVRAWRYEYSEYHDATPTERTALARWLQERRPLPRWLARVGYRRFLRHLLEEEASETAVFLLAHRHHYSPHTVRRYIRRFMERHRVISLVAFGAEYVDPDAFSETGEYWRACAGGAVACLSPCAAHLPRAWARALESAAEALDPDAPYFSR